MVTISRKLSRNVRYVKESTNMHNSCLMMINNSSYCLQVKKKKARIPKIGSSLSPPQPPLYPHPQPQAKGNSGVSLETMVAASQGCRTRFEQYFSTQ